MTDDVKVGEVVEVKLYEHTPTSTGPTTKEVWVTAMLVHVVAHQITAQFVDGSLRAIPKNQGRFRKVGR